MVLLSFRRLASLSSQRNTIKKLLDSGIYIAIATLFNSWSIWFMIMPFMALLYHSESIITYWLIPLMGFSSIAILTYTFGGCIPRWDPIHSNTFLYSFNFSAYKAPQLSLAIGFLVFLLLWSLLIYVPSISKKKRVLRPVYKLTLVYLALSIVVIVLQPFKLGTELVFLLSPFAVICANYFQWPTSNWIKDSIFYLWILLVLLLAIKT